MKTCNECDRKCENNPIYCPDRWEPINLSAFMKALKEVKYER